MKDILSSDQLMLLLSEMAQMDMLRVLMQTMTMMQTMHGAELPTGGQDSIRIRTSIPDRRGIAIDSDGLMGILPGSR